ncbi:unnamed protein product [Spodoptera exigua]|nr:unnamed protein product [Spodoptera exigua]
MCTYSSCLCKLAVMLMEPAVLVSGMNFLLMVAVAVAVSEAEAEAVVVVVEVVVVLYAVLGMAAMAIGSLNLEPLVVVTQLMAQVVALVDEESAAVVEAVSALGLLPVLVALEGPSRFGLIWP